MQRKISTEKPERKVALRKPKESWSSMYHLHNISVSWFYFLLLWSFAVVTWWSARVIPMGVHNCCLRTSAFTYRHSTAQTEITIAIITIQVHALSRDQGKLLQRIIWIDAVSSIHTAKSCWCTGNSILHFKELLVELWPLVSKILALSIHVQP